MEKPEEKKSTIKKDPEENKIHTPTPPQVMDPSVPPEKGKNKNGSDADDVSESQKRKQTK